MLGMLFLPLIYLLLPRMIVEFSRKKMLRIGPRGRRVEPTDKQREVLGASMHRCTDVHWLNAAVQRFYIEVSRSYASKVRVKSMILKRFESMKSSGYIRNIEITGIELGMEAPYVKNVQIVTEEDVHKMASGGVSEMADEEEKLVRLEDEIRKRLEHEVFRKETGGIVDGEPVELIRHRFGDSQESLRKEESESEDQRHFGDVSESSTKTECGRPDGNEADRRISSSKAFDRLHILLGMDYGGGMRISLNVELPKKIVLKVVVFVNRLRGNVVVRLPSRDYTTRMEYCFLSSPEIRIVVESGITNMVGRLYFRKSISNFLERYMRRSVLRTMVYPSWSTQYLPFVVPSMRNINHRIEKVCQSNHRVQIPQIVESVLLYMAMDYKIADVEDDAVYRKSNYFINGEDRITCVHFPIPRAALNTSHFAQKNLFFKDLSVQESKVMTQIYTWMLFCDVLPGFQELKIETTLGSDSCLVRLVFENTQYEFLRLAVGNTLIFQRNDAVAPEFLAFRISEETLYIYQYVVTEQLSVSRRRIDRLRKKLSLKPLAMQSSSIYRMLGLSPREALDREKESVHESEGSPAREQDEEVGTELTDIFLSIKASIDDAMYISKKMCSKAHPETIHRVLSQDEVRIKLFSEECGIYTVIDETDNIRSIVVENRVSYRSSACANDADAILEMSPEEDFVVHSYFEPGLIIDLKVQSTREAFVYRIMPMDDPSCSYKSKILLFYTRTSGVCFPNYFVEAFQLRIRQDEYLSIAEGFPSETCLIEREFRREIKVARGGIYIEFSTEVPDDFSLMVHSVKNCDVVYDIYKIITSRRARIVLPVTCEDTLTAVLIPKFSRNRQIECKFVSLPEEFCTETLVDCNIGLSKNMKLHCPVSGNTDSVIFWEKTDDDEVRGYIEDSETRVMITKNGSMRTDNKEYSIFYKNKGEKKRDIKVFLGMSLRRA